MAENHLEGLTAVATLDLSQCARRYLASGLCVLPAHRLEKRPAIKQRWEPFKSRLPTAAEIDGWFAHARDGLCLVCGSVSGHLEMIDFDCAGERFEPWKARVEAAAPSLLSKLVVESTPSRGWHAAYRCRSPVCGNLKLAQRKHTVTAEEIQRDEQGREVATLYGKPFAVRADPNGSKYVLLTLVETRGEGGLFLCAPTEGYQVVQGDLCELPVLTEAERDALLQAAWELNEYVPPVVDAPVRPSDTQRPATSAAAGRPGDDYNRRGDVRTVLQQHGWALAKPGDNEYWRRPGKSCGWSATLRDGVFYAFSSSAEPFEPNRAYSPFAVYAMLGHGGDFEKAAGALRGLGYGIDALPQEDPQVDISRIIASEGRGDADDDEDDSEAVEPETSVADPGPTPDRLLAVPGFMQELMDFCVEAAPYPSPPMAFCGALAMQSHLCGRRVRDPGDLRTNLYILALASSSAGKNYPRQLNSHLAIEANMVETLRMKFASGEGLEDQMQAHPCTLFQTDEVDGILQSVTRARDARHESILNVLLVFYSSANTTYAMRNKAGRQESSLIPQPHLSVFGTATPGSYYQSLSERLLTNGFFGRTLILDTGKRGLGQDARPVDEMPRRVIETAAWWSQFQPGEHRGNLLGFFPRPAIVAHTDKAKALADEFRRSCDEQYSQAETRGDEVATTVWGRANESARKLALIYACSENHKSPAISPAAVRWASAFVEHQVRRMLFMAGLYVAQDEFDAVCKKAVRILRAMHEKKGPDALMPEWKFRRKVRARPQDFLQLVQELRQRREVYFDSQPGKTKPRCGYRLWREGDRA